MRVGDIAAGPGACPHGNHGRAISMRLQAQRQVGHLVFGGQRVGPTSA